MEKFDINESWLVKINNSLEEQNEALSEKDVKFFNLKILKDTARLTQRFSHKCEICKANKIIIEELSKNAEQKLSSIVGRREVTGNIDSIIKHLRIKHKMYIKNHLLSAITLISMIAGLVLGSILGYFLQNYRFPILLCFAIGLIGGRIIGKIIENKLHKKNQIYGEN